LNVFFLLVNFQTLELRLNGNMVCIKLKILISCIVLNKSSARKFNVFT
jgi:hypothetical protein